MSLRCALHTNGAQNLLKCDEYTLMRLNDDGLQTLTRSRSTDNDLEDCGLL